MLKGETMTTKKKLLRAMMIVLAVAVACCGLSTCATWMLTPSEVATVIEVTATPTVTVLVPTEVIPTSTPEPTSTPTPTSTPRTAWTPHPTPRPLPTSTLTPKPAKVPVTQEPVKVPPTSVPLGPARTEAQVVSVVDGDTIKVEVGGTQYTLRYIGIDTPETVHPSKPVEWMGLEASAANQQLVAGKTVYLEKDISETDRYGRLLRYVYLADGLFVNAELVRLGYAQVSTYPPDVQYVDMFLQLQQEAREAERGLWGAVPTPPESTSVPAPSEPVAGPASWACPSSTDGAMYVGSANSDKYHKLSCTCAGKIKPENRICFGSREAAEAAGYVPCKVCKP